MILSPFKKTKIKGAWTQFSVWYEVVALICMARYNRSRSYRRSDSRAGDDGELD